MLIKKKSIKVNVKGDNLKEIEMFLSKLFEYWKYKHYYFKSQSQYKKIIKLQPMIPKIN